MHNEHLRQNDSPGINAAQKRRLFSIARINTDIIETSVLMLLQASLALFRFCFEIAMSVRGERLFQDALGHLSRKKQMAINQTGHLALKNRRQNTHLTIILRALPIIPLSGNAC